MVKVKHTTHKISSSPHVQKKRPTKKHKKRGISFPEKPPKGWMVAGFDVSMSSIAGAAIAWDAILKKFKGPAFAEIRWTKEDEYFDRLNAAARSHEIVLDLQAELLLSLALEDIWIAQEEPWPPHGSFIKRGNSGWLKQQAEMSGAFLGGLTRYGFTHISQMGSIRWRGVIAEMISESTGEDVTTHHSKWRSGKLAQQYNCKPTDSGKFRTKQWALDVMAPYFGQQFSVPNVVPDWPDIIESTKLGRIPRPEGSKAKAIQPEDCYDALAICWTEYLDLKSSGLIP